MITLLTYPAAKPSLSDSSLGVRKETRAAAFSDEVWELHHVIANPVAPAHAVLMAKRQLLRRLGGIPACGSEKGIEVPITR